jgi:Gpi18-like mannosyltransferase
MVSVRQPTAGFGSRLAMGIHRHFSRQHYSWQCANNLRRLRAVDARHGFSASLSSLLQRIHATYMDAQRFHGLVDKHSTLRASHVSHVHTTRASRTQKNAQLCNIGSLHGGIVLFHSAVGNGLLGFLKQFDKMRKRMHACVLWRTRANVFPINFYLELSKLESHQGKRTMRLPFERRETISLVALLLFSLLVRLLLFPLPGYKADLSIFAWWFNAAAEHGIRVFYSVVGSDYPPFNVYLFWIFGSIAKQLSPSGTNIVSFIKLLPNLFDTATAFLIFAFVRKRLSFKIALLATALYAFNPAVIFNAAVWGQYDAIYTFFLVLSLMLVLASKPELSAVAFTIGLLTKPQSIALAPLIAFLIFRKHGWRRLLTSLLVAAATIFVVIIPFEWSNPVTFLTNIYFGAYGGYPYYAYTTVNAFNIWAFGGMWQAETLTSFLMGWIMFGALVVFAFYVLHKRLDVSGELLILFSAFMLFFGFFMLPTRIHERYLFPALSILALMIPFAKKVRPIYAVLTFTCLANQAYVLDFLNNNQFIQFGDPVVWIVTLINLAAFLYALVLMIGDLRGQELGQVQSSQSPSESHLEGSSGNAHQ